eukprot:TRINITY_DN552_c0_g1_i2.p1 TRINITY_DN552_c0_g1~~TRINITY_DN552_c0_g1_i2.p1  ORF type:complete len:188 (+),score=24.76 TRINITY_DN552_c0_g1_i2:110-673(+)
MSLSKVKFVWSYYLHLLKYAPIPTKALTSALISYSGSVITQKVFEKSPKMNQTRALKFVIFSLMLTPISHYWYKFLDAIFPKESSDQGQLLDPSAIKKLALDELLYDPFCIVFFFTVIGILEGNSFAHIKQKLVKEYWPTQKASWALWPAVQLVNFSVVPGHLRILFINFVSFFWSIFMQLRQSKQL